MAGDGFAHCGKVARHRSKEGPHLGRRQKSQQVRDPLTSGRKRHSSGVAMVCICVVGNASEPSTSVLASRQPGGQEEDCPTSGLRS